MNSRMIASALMSVTAGTAMMLFPSCEDGILVGIYDEPEEKSAYGFVQTETLVGHGTIYINTSQYTHWVCLDFQEATADSVNIVLGDPFPEQWDMAVHRYDVKTNGGSAAMTSWTDIEEFEDSGTMPEDAAFVSDIMTDDVIAVDMSGMMQGNIVYAQDWYNPELSKWLDVDTSTMPPVYTKSDNVFVLRLADGRNIALRLENYMDGSGTKGYMTIQYKTLTGEVEL